MSEYDKVQAGERIRAFLNDEFVTMAMERLERNALYAFKVAKTDDDRRMAQAQALTVDLFAGLLTQMVDEGELAKNG